MTFRLVVLSAGLSQPSSTRLLADRLAAAAAARLRGAGQEVDVTTLELRPLAHDITDAMLSDFPSGALTAGAGGGRAGGCAHRRHAGLRGHVLRTLQVVHRRRATRRPGGHAGAHRRDRRKRPAQPGRRPRAAAALRLPPGRHRADRRLRGDRRLRRRRRGRSRPRGSSGRPRSWRASSDLRAPRAMTRAKAPAMRRPGGRRRRRSPAPARRTRWRTSRRSPSCSRRDAS